MTPANFILPVTSKQKPELFRKNQFLPTQQSSTTISQQPTTSQTTTPTTTTTIKKAITTTITTTEKLTTTLTSLKSADKETESHKDESDSDNVNDEDTVDDDARTPDTSHWATMSSFKLSEGLTVTKYRSNLTGLTVVLAKAESPIVNGYFCLATEV